MSCEMALLFKHPVRSLKLPNGCWRMYFTDKIKKKIDEKEIKRCCNILGVEESSNLEQIRIAYLDMVKRYHPDSGTEEARAEKFHEIDKAFRILVDKTKLSHNTTEECNVVQEQDIKHTAPQHRQYLSFGGLGAGNPFQREKQYTKIRASQAAQNVYNHRISKVTAEEHALLDKVPLKHKIKTKYGFERLVEDLIQESMSKGEFDNLKNTGKPLPSYESRNPYVDFITHKLNEVLIDNGFTPEWILLQKEIREDILILRKNLFTERQYFGPYPLTIEDNIEWSEQVYKYKELVNKINKKIAKFNLVVPILNKQMIPICLEKEAQKAIVIGQGYEDLRSESSTVKDSHRKIDQSSSKTDGLLSIFSLFFKGQ